MKSRNGSGAASAVPRRGRYLLDAEFSYVLISRIYSHGELLRFEATRLLGPRPLIFAWVTDSVCLEGRRETGSCRSPHSGMRPNRRHGNETHFSQGAGNPHCR